MNKWKVLFLALLTIVVLGIVSIFVLVFTGNTDMKKPTPTAHKGNEFSISTKPQDFENLANKFIFDATEGSKVQVEMAIDDDVKITSNVDALGVNIPITLDFDPEIDEHGNLLLHQTNVSVGKLNIPAQTALKLVRDSADLPDFLTIQPSEKTAYIDLTAIDIPLGDLAEGHIKAKTFDLKNDNIELQLIIPQN